MKINNIINKPNSSNTLSSNLSKINSNEPMVLLGLDDGIYKNNKNKDEIILKVIQEGGVNKLFDSITKKNIIKNEIIGVFLNRIINDTNSNIDINKDDTTILFNIIYNSVLDNNNIDKILKWLNNLKSNNFIDDNSNLANRVRLELSSAQLIPIDLTLKYGLNASKNVSLYNNLLLIEHNKEIKEYWQNNSKEYLEKITEDNNIEEFSAFIFKTDLQLDKKPDIKTIVENKIKELSDEEKIIFLSRYIPSYEVNDNLKNIVYNISNDVIINCAYSIDGDLIMKHSVDKNVFNIKDKEKLISYYEKYGDINLGNSRLNVLDFIFDINDKDFTSSKIISDFITKNYYVIYKNHNNTRYYKLTNDDNDGSIKFYNPLIFKYLLNNEFSIDNLLKDNTKIKFLKKMLDENTRVDFINDFYIKTFNDFYKLDKNTVIKNKNDIDLLINNFIRKSYYDNNLINNFNNESIKNYIETLNIKQSLDFLNKFPRLQDNNEFKDIEIVNDVKNIIKDKLLSNKDLLIQEIKISSNLANSIINSALYIGGIFNNEELKKLLNVSLFNELDNEIKIKIVENIKLDKQFILNMKISDYSDWKNVLYESILKNQDIDEGMLYIFKYKNKIDIDLINKYYPDFEKENQILKENINNKKGSDIFIDNLFKDRSLNDMNNIIDLSSEDIDNIINMINSESIGERADLLGELIGNIKNYGDDNNLNEIIISSIPVLNKYLRFLDDLNNISKLNDDTLTHLGGILNNIFVNLYLNNDGLKDISIPLSIYKQITGGTKLSKIISFDNIHTPNKILSSNIYLKHINKEDIINNFSETIILYLETNTLKPEDIEFLKEILKEKDINFSGIEILFKKYNTFINANDGFFSTTPLDKLKSGLLYEIFITIMNNYNNGLIDNLEFQKIMINPLVKITMTEEEVKNVHNLALTAIKKSLDNDENYFTLNILSEFYKGNNKIDIFDSLGEEYMFKVLSNIDNIKLVTGEDFQKHLFNKLLTSSLNGNTRAEEYLIKLLKDFYNIDKSNNNINKNDKDINNKKAYFNRDFYDILTKIRLNNINDLKLNNKISDNLLNNIDFITLITNKISNSEELHNIIINESILLRKMDSIELDTNNDHDISIVEKELSFAYSDSLKTLSKKIENSGVFNYMAQIIESDKFDIEEYMRLIGTNTNSSNHGKLFKDFIKKISNGYFQKNDNNFVIAYNQLNNYYPDFTNNILKSYSKYIVNNNLKEDFDDVFLEGIKGDSNLSSMNKVKKISELFGKNNISNIMNWIK